MAQQEIDAAEEEIKEQLRRGLEIARELLTTVRHSASGADQRWHKAADTDIVTDDGRTKGHILQNQTLVGRLVAFLSDGTASLLAHEHAVNTAAHERVAAQAKAEAAKAAAP